MHLTPGGRNNGLKYYRSERWCLRRLSRYLQFAACLKYCVLRYCKSLIVVFFLWHRHVVNGEILGVSLLLEDVLQNGLTDIFAQHPDDSSTAKLLSRPGTSTSRKPSTRHGENPDSEDDVEPTVPVETGPYGDIPKGPISFSTNPQAAVKLVNLFLLVCSRLELLKTDWGCRKLGVNEISTSKLYRTLWWVSVRVIKWSKLYKRNNRLWKQFTKNKGHLFSVSQQSVQDWNSTASLSTSCSEIWPGM